MKRTFVLGLGAATLALGLVSVLPVAAQDQPRDAETILKAIDAVKMPPIPANRQDQNAIRAYIQEMTKAREEKAGLIRELYLAAPDHELLPKLLPERWMTLPPATMEKEVDELLAKTESKPLRAEALFMKARTAFMNNRNNIDAALPALEEFAKAVPDDDRVPQILSAIASMTRDKTKKAALEDRVLTDYPKSGAAESIKGQRRRAEGVGKPFEIEFQDAVHGKTITMDDLKGKVVVIDFWATWCGPCIAEMPKMKQLYADYKEKGVEFIGVSLDAPKEEGGLDALKKYVADNDIQWPQYYQGNGWESAFSRSWGINSIPAVFIVDAEGKLHSVEARGKLEQMIPDLLKKRDSAGAGGQ